MIDIKFKAHKILIQILSVLCITVSCCYADGVRDFGAPVYVRVPAYCKKIVVGDFNNDKIDDFASLHWEIDDRGVIHLPDGTSDIYGRKALVGVFLSTPHPMSPAPTGPPVMKKAVSFQAPYFLKYGTSTTGQYENDLIAADMDGKNGPDLVLLNSASKKIMIYLNNGTGHFEASPDIQFGIRSASLPDVREYPFQMAVGDFNADSRKDVAVSYIYHSSVSKDLVVAVYLGHGSRFEEGATFWNIDDFSKKGFPPSILPLLNYRWGSPYYTIGYSDERQGRGEVFQLSAIRGAGQTYDSVLFRVNSHSIYRWDYITGISQNEVDFFDASDLYFRGPYITTNLDNGGGADRYDFIMGGGIGVMFNEGETTWATVPRALSSLPTGGMVAADFDLDGAMDLATLRGDNYTTQVAGSELMIAFGTGAKENPLITGGVKAITGLSVFARWWENPAVMLTGGFTGETHPMTSAPFQSILVLGSDVVTIYPNLGAEPQQLATPQLHDLLTPLDVNIGDRVEISGQLFTGLQSEITDVHIIKEDGADSAFINRAAFDLKGGMTQTVSFALPKLKPGAYNITVKNEMHVSNVQRIIVH